MNQDARDLWTRAVRSHTTSAKLAEEDLDSAASRAYYAAFYAVSAWFALQGKTFTKHRALEAAVHRNLVKPEGRGRRTWEQISPGWSACAEPGTMVEPNTSHRTKLARL